MKIIYLLGKLNKANILRRKGFCNKIAKYAQFNFFYSIFFLFANKILNKQFQKNLIFFKKVLNQFFSKQKFDLINKFQRR